MTALVKYEEARRALAEAHSVDEVAQIRDRAEAARQAARIAGDIEMVNWAAEIRIRAERKAGELLKEMAEAGARAEKGGDQRSLESSSSVRLDDLGIDKHESSRWQKVAAVPEAEFERYLSETKTEGRELTSAGVRKLAKQSATGQRAYGPEGARCCTELDLQTLADTIESGARSPFGTVCADPPWRYANQGTRGATGDHYVGMTVDEICALPVSKMIAEEAHLHLWTTNNFLFDAKQVIEAWGFTYKSCYVWVKKQIGMGNYWRVSHEFLLLGVRGTLTFKDKSLRSWDEFPRSQHSAKPERVWDRIYRASPGPYLEMFARRAAPGRVCWGNEIDKDVFYEEVSAA